jgi:hypothetical protein
MIAKALVLVQEGHSFDQTTVYIPNTTSRRALYLHAFSAHERYNVPNLPDSMEYSLTAEHDSPPERVKAYVNDMVKRLSEGSESTTV